MERASDLALSLREAAKDADPDSDLARLALRAADRLISQENQLGGFINRLLSRMSPQKAAVEMLKAGISREEATACWGVPPAMSVQAEKEKNEVPRSRRVE